MRIIKAAAISSPAVSSRRAKCDGYFRVSFLLGAHPLDHTACASPICHAQYRNGNRTLRRNSAHGRLRPTFPMCARPHAPSAPIRRAPEQRVNLALSRSQRLSQGVGVLRRVSPRPAWPRRTLLWNDDHRAIAQPSRHRPGHNNQNPAMHNDATARALCDAQRAAKSSQVNTLPKAKSQAEDKRAKDRQ
jgi:hypothetical protein